MKLMSIETKDVRLEIVSKMDNLNYTPHYVVLKNGKEIFRSDFFEEARAFLF
jgi:hypothetical protein